MRILETKVYTFAELSESAKEAAIQWYQEGSSKFFRPDYDDFVRVAEILGFHLKQNRIRLVNREYRDKPAIYYTGFYSQGDGACFEASYCYAKGSCAEIRKYAPKDAALHSIADRLFAMQQPLFYRLTAESKHSGYYYHEYSMSICLNDEYESDIEANMAECFRDLARWLYCQLESEYEYVTSREYAIEGIAANQYEFTESGEVV